MSSSKKPPKDAQYKAIFTEKTSDNKIRLKSVWGISPLTYIPIFYFLLLVIIPSIWAYSSLVKKNGQIVKISSIPTHAAVLVDDEFVGTTPLHTQVTKGTHTISVSLPYFSEFKEELKIKNPLIKFIRTKKLNLALEPEGLDRALASTGYFTDFDEDNIIKNTIKEIASWNIANSNNSRFTIPRSLELRMSQLFEVLQFTIKNNQNQERVDLIYKLVNVMYYILYYSIPYLSNSSQSNTLSEEEETWILYFNKLDMYTVGIPSKEQHIAYFFDDTLTQTLDNFSQSLKERGDKSSQVRHWNIDYKYTRYTPTQFDTHSYRIANLPFTLVEEHNVLYQEQILDMVELTDPIHRYMEISNVNNLLEDISDIRIRTPRFYVMDREINQKDFQAFLNAKGISIEEWKSEHQIYVSPDHIHQYFKDFDPEAHPLRPLRFITWYDAQEYLVWINLQLSNTQFRAKLPNEFEWQAAVAQYPDESILGGDINYFQEHSNTQKNLHLFGSLWEWGDSWYSPNPQYSEYQGPIFGSEKHIFGGSYITKKSDKMLDTPLYKSRNTSAPPNWANEYIGFRLILVSK